MIQHSEALRCSLTMADSMFDEIVDNNPIILKMEARLDGSRILMSMPTITSLSRFISFSRFCGERDLLQVHYLACDCAVFLMHSEQSLTASRGSFKDKSGVGWDDC